MRDILDKATGGEFKKWAENQKGTSLRSTAFPYMTHMPTLGLGLNFLQSWRIDCPTTLWDEMYLPETLHRAVLGFTSESGPLGANNEVIYEGVTNEGNVEFLRVDTLLFIGLIAAMVLLILGIYCPRLASLLYGVIFIAIGLLGTLLLAMMLGTNMNVTYWNLNILFINPLFFILAFRTRKKCKALPVAIGAMIVLLGLTVLKAPFYQDANLLIALLLPIYISRTTFQRGAKVKE